MGADGWGVGADGWGVGADGRGLGADGRGLGADGWVVRFGQPSVQSPILELAANRGSSRMSPASKLHIATQLLNTAQTLT